MHLLITGATVLPSVSALVYNMGYCAALVCSMQYGTSGQCFFSLTGVMVLRMVNVMVPRLVSALVYKGVLQLQLVKTPACGRCSTVQLMPPCAKYVSHRDECRNTLSPLAIKYLVRQGKLIVALPVEPNPILSTLKLFLAPNLLKVIGVIDRN